MDRRGCDSSLTGARVGGDGSARRTRSLLHKVWRHERQVILASGEFLAMVECPERLSLWLSDGVRSPIVTPCHRCYRPWRPIGPHGIGGNNRTESVSRDGPDVPLLPGADAVEPRHDGSSHPSRQDSQRLVRVHCVELCRGTTGSSRAGRPAGRSSGSARNGSLVPPGWSTLFEVARVMKAT